MPAPHIKRNSQAIRWCKAHKMTISFENWKEHHTSPLSDNIPEGVSCKLSYTMNREIHDYPTVFGKNLIDCVNEAIRILKEKEDGK